MTSLEDQQRGLLDLVKRRGGPVSDPYLERVAASPGLAIVRETALFWRTFQVEAQCRSTSCLLKRLGWFDALVAGYFDSNATSPYVEELSRDFLRWLSMHGDALVRAVSQFELAVLEVKSGSADVFEIRWDRDPGLVLRALETGLQIPAAEAGNLYRVRVGRELPGMIACTRERTTG